LPGPRGGRTSRRLAPGVLTLFASLLAFAAPAHAIYGPAAGGLGANIVSVDNASDEQGNGATTDADISANGQYVVFQTKATNFFEDDGESQQEREAAEPPDTLREGGIFRYDRATGQLQLVASGNLVVAEGSEAGKVLIRGAVNPSVSAEGRYVAFASAQKLVPQDTDCATDAPQGTIYCNVQVYERDMDVAPSQTGAYTLVSAQNGSEDPPVYEATSTPIAGGDPGTQLWPNTAISANGRYVLFRTAEVKSSLPEGVTVTTEKNQLFVRDLLAQTTTLVTRKKQGEPEAGASAGGAEGPATLSADGSTIAWVGRNAPEQTAFVSGEDSESSTSYYLWRRWQEPGSPTRRITGISDPEDPACPPGSTINSGSPTATGPCYGPLSSPESSGAGISAQAPGLSADGDTVAFLAGSQLRPGDTKPDALDVFLASMSQGVTRKAGTRELTLAINGAQGDGNASITSLALSADGSHIAFVSQRNAFALPEPATTGSFSTTGEQSELDVIDLATNTLERAVVGLEGVEPNGSTLSNPTLTADGSTLAFASSASNLIFGDANGLSDAFTATLQVAGGTAAPPAGVNAGAGGFSFSAIASPELGVSVKRAKDGGLLLLVETPGAGKLTAEAHGSISKAAPAKTAKKVRKANASSALARVSRAKKVTKKKAPPAVLLASASAAVRSEGTTTLTLRLSSKYVKDLQRAGKLKANVKIDFTPTAPSESALSDEVSATFLAAPAAKKSSDKGKVKKG
jgi:Tol biopolymer transport system component